MSNPSKSDQHFWTIVIIAVSCGIFAGILGAILARIYIIPNFSPAYYNEVNLANLNGNNLGFIIRNPQKVVVNQDVKTTETINNIRPGLVGVFKLISTSTSPVSKISAQNAPSYYKLDHPLFIGLIITSDGWVVALAPNDLKTNFNPQKYIVIGNDRQSYKIDRVLDSEKSPGKLLLIHLAGASNLPVKKIVSRSDLSLGQSLLIVNGVDSVLPTTLSSLVKTSGVLSSDGLNATLTLGDGTNNHFKNSLVFNLAGDLVAIITTKQKIIPAFSYKASWSALTQKTPVLRPFLGVNYLDLSLIKTKATNEKQGAWLYPSATQPAVLKNSPAGLAGLQAGDIITWVNNQKVNVHNDLADLLSNYKAGDTVTLTYLRAGQEKSVNIKLGELKQ